eukprot:scpid5240/ scgid17162/ 
MYPASLVITTTSPVSACSADVLFSAGMADVLFSACRADGVHQTLTLLCPWEEVEVIRAIPTSFLLCMSHHCSQSRQLHNMSGLLHGCYLDYLSQLDMNMLSLNSRKSPPIRGIFLEGFMCTALSF